MTGVKKVNESNIFRDFWIDMPRSFSTGAASRGGDLTQFGVECLMFSRLWPVCARCEQVTVPAF